MTVTRVVVVGAGIAGLSCAFDLITHDPSLDVVLLEADDRTGGKIHTTPFAGMAVDEAADALEPITRPTPTPAPRAVARDY